MWPFASKTELTPLSMQLTDPLQKTDEDICSQIIDEGMGIIMAWQSESDTFWDDAKSHSVNGLGSVTVKSKSMGEHPRLFLGVGDWPDVSFEELILLTEARPGAAKERFDPSVKKFLKLHGFQTTAGEEISIVKTTTHPALMGMISARECDDVLTIRALPNGCMMNFGVGLQSPLFQRHASASKRLQNLSNAPTVESGIIKVTDYTSGFYFEPLDGTLKAGGRGKVRLWYFLQSDAGGNIPRWATDQAMPAAIVSFFSGAFQELQKIRNK